MLFLSLHIHAESLSSPSTSVFARAQLMLPSGVHVSFPVGGEIRYSVGQILYINGLTILLLARGVNDLPKFIMIQAQV